MTHTWSAQDYQATNLMPFFGKLPRGRGRIYFATGYNKWGMTNAVAASLDITADILGGHLPWANTIHRRVTSPPGAASAVTLNAGVAATLAKDWAQAGLKSCPRVGRPARRGDGGRGSARAEARGNVHRRRNHVQPVCRLHPPRRDTPLERQRKILGLPAARLPVQHEGQVLEGPATHDLPAPAAPG